MLRSFWTQAKAFVYDSVAGLFRSQAEIDIEVESTLSDYGTVEYDENNLPGEARLRRRVFYSPQDAITWIQDGGIPADYVYIVPVQNYNLDDTAYQVWVVG